tara:strand:- start:150 stop:539 length:390 start_codon:yes stop_codon:yes gene_type:complete
MSDSEENNKDTITVSEDFKSNVKEWIEIDNKERELKPQLRILSTKKKELTESIIKEMESNNIGDLNINTGGKLKYSVSNVVAPLKKDVVINVISKEIDDETKARSIITQLYDKETRGVSKRVSLKRVSK